MRPSAVRCMLAGWFVVAVSACVAYEPKPLDAAHVIADVDAIRRRPQEPPPSHDHDVFTLTQATRRMIASSPTLKEETAALRAALALAEVPTPLPNPMLQLGPQVGLGSDVGGIREVTPFGSISFSLPLNGRLEKQDALNRTRADVARVNYIAKHRELYLQLRALYARLVLARTREGLQREISDAARQTIDVSHQMVDAGAATAVDIALFELEYAKNLAAQLSAEQSSVETEIALSELIGAHTQVLAGASTSELPDLPASPLPLDDLRKLLANQHPVLGRLRAQYALAEAALRLEIAEQYPNFSFGPVFNAEPGERRTSLGLTLGIKLPIFDRNQQGIAQAEARREQVRSQFEAAANRALAKLEGAYRLLRLANRRRTLIRDSIAPRAAKSVEIARDSLAAGSGDAIRLLDSERSERMIRIEQLVAEASVRQAWSNLEQAVGCSLLTWPSEVEQPALDLGIRPPHHHPSDRLPEAPNE